MKSKKLLMMLLVVCSMAFAEGIEVVQYTPSDFNLYSTVQNWEEARMITLNVSAGSTVYLSNYVNKVSQNQWNPNPIPNLGDANMVTEYGEAFYGYNMSDKKFGYMIAEKTADGKVTTDGVIHWGTQETAPVTYTGLNATQEMLDSGYGTQTTTGYKLGTFDKDTEIFFVMTPNGYNTTVNSYDYVDWPNGGENAVSSILQSRQINTLDIAGNVRVNFGLVDGHAHEFVIGYVADPSTPEPPSGQPLPGVLTSCLVALGATGIAARRRKQSRK